MHMWTSENKKVGQKIVLIDKVLVLQQNISYLDWRMYVLKIVVTAVIFLAPHLSSIVSVKPNLKYVEIKSHGNEWLTENE